MTTKHIVKLSSRDTLRFVDEDAGDELAACITSSISVEWNDNGFGLLSVGDSRINHQSWEPALRDDVICVDVTDLSTVPVQGKATYRDGGCDGEHRGHCRHYCREVEFNIQISLLSVKKVDGRLVATYELQESR